MERIGNNMSENSRSQWFPTAFTAARGESWSRGDIEKEPKATANTKESIQIQHFDLEVSGKNVFTFIDVRSTVMVNLFRWIFFHFFFSTRLLVCVCFSFLLLPPSARNAAT